VFSNVNSTFVAGYVVYNMVMWGAMKDAASRKGARKENLLAASVTENY